MENTIKENDALNKKIQKIEKQIQPALYEESFDKTGINIEKETEKELNAKILTVTMTIKDKYPELSKYLEEVPETIPDETNPDITLKNLKTYYDSLNSILNNYILEHPIKNIKRNMIKK
jgi:hypothetical protein